MALPLTLERRAFLKAALAAAAAPALPDMSFAQSRAAATKSVTTAAPSARKFFNAREWAILDEMADLIVPADSRSGGARAAGVVPDIDRMLASIRDDREKQSWRDDLAEIDRLSNLWYGKSFTKASSDQRIKLLTRVSSNEAKPSEPGEYAFGTIKWTVTELYYRSRIGIHDELDYKGNTAIDEFVGTDISKP